jgi:hypothetical protein
MFAFPNDLRLTYSSLNRFPLPVFFTFVFTDQNGAHLYAACLRFYEIVPVEDLQPVFKEVYGEEQRLEILPGSEIFCPKVVCVVSKRPFYRYECYSRDNLRTTITKQNTCCCYYPER